MSPSTFNRQNTAPFLLRVFRKQGDFHHIDEFDGGVVPSPDELNLYTWKDATLNEILDHLRDDLPSLESGFKSTYQIRFRLVYGDYKRGRFEVKDIGFVQIGTRGFDEDKTLEEARFLVGDYIDLAILQPGDRGYVNEQKRSHTRQPQRIRSGNRDGGPDRAAGGLTRRVYNRPDRVGGRNQGPSFPRRRESAPYNNERW